jgi:hypothetical protein
VIFTGPPSGARRVPSADWHPAPRTLWMSDPRRGLQGLSPQLSAAFGTLVTSAAAAHSGTSSPPFVAGLTTSGASFPSFAPQSRA